MKGPTGPQKRKSLRLAERGFALLRAGDYEEALQVAIELEALRYTAAYDIAAQAHAGMGDLDAAIATLERGLEKAPDCWPNWRLLGNYRSDAGDYDAAASAYERALTCPNVDEDSIRLNQAILANRRGHHAAAQAILDRVTDPELRLEVAVTRVLVLEAMGRLDEAEALGERTLAGAPEDVAPDRNLACVIAALARIRLQRGLPSGEVRRFILDSLEQYGDTPELLALVREIDGRYSDRAQYLRLMVNVRLAPESDLCSDAIGYLVNYEVIAEDPEQALEMAKELEGDTAGEFEIEESEVVEPRPEDAMGVCWRTDKAFYQTEDDE